jgi:uncharacterized membrane protein YtjA (UPF0391 family)
MEERAGTFVGIRRFPFVHINQRLEARPLAVSSFERPVSRAFEAGAVRPALGNPRRCQMFKWALIFAVIALVAAVLGFGGVAGAAAGIAKILFFVGLALVVLFLILGSAAARKIT